MAQITTTDVCSRCKGRGWGDWVVEHGICFACRGTGKASTARRLRAEAKARTAWMLAVERVAFTFEADRFITAAHLLHEQELYGLPVEIEPGLWVVEVSRHPSFMGYDEAGQPVYATPAP